MSQTNLTEDLKAYARELGADLTGVAPVGRWEKAPLENSPLGIMPESRSVFVCGLHFLDANTELAAEEDPRHPGPGFSEANATVHLFEMGFCLARWLQARGHQALAIPCTGLWAYRPRAGAERGWMADMVHYYAAAAAGLGEIGWHNLCITPEYGTRQRFTTVVTDAELEPTPMYEGDPLCDRCLLCAQNCPTECFEKEVNGMCSVEIEGHTYTFPNRNLWRCAIGENFQFDVFQPQPEQVTEETLKAQLEDAVRNHPERITGWKMGMCLKWCVPPQRRYFDLDYCRSPRRRRDVEPDTSPERCQRLVAELEEVGSQWHVTHLAIAEASQCAEQGLDLRQLLPDGESLVVFGHSYPPNCRGLVGTRNGNSELALARHLQAQGFSALIVKVDLDPAEAAVIAGAAQRDAAGNIIVPGYDDREIWSAVITSAPLPRTPLRSMAPEKVSPPEPATLAARLEEIARQAGADVFGVTSAEATQTTAQALRPIMAEQGEYFVVEDRPFVGAQGVWGGQLMPYTPEVVPTELKPQCAEDHLPGAKSVIVVGVRLLNASIDHAGTPPAHKASHYQYSVHDAPPGLLREVQMAMAEYLDACGYHCQAVRDLEGLASALYAGGTDLTASRFAAVAAGLGELGWNGLLLTPEYGARQALACLVTDAPLPPSAPYAGPTLCKRCYACVRSCPTTAIAGEESHCLTINGREVTWGRTDRLRCDAAKRYALVAGEGPAYIGSKNDFSLPEEITPEFVCEAMRDSDRLQRPGYCPIIEHCFTNCPAHLGPERQS